MGEPVHINSVGETSRDCCFVANAVQANLLAATTANSEARNQVYNVAVGDRTSLNELYALLHRNLLPHYPQLQGAQPAYRDFRAGDVRHSEADIGKAQRLLGFAPSHRLTEGVLVSLSWYVRNWQRVNSGELTTSSSETLARQARAIQFGAIFGATPIDK